MGFFSWIGQKLAGIPEPVYAGLVGAGKIVERKVVGALLIAILVMAGFSQLANHLYHHTELEESAFRVLTETAGEGEAAEVVEEEVIDFGPLLAAASPDAGQTLFSRRCTSCHTIESGGANKVGPNLWNRVGGAKAGADGYAYSGTLSDMGGEWSFDDLNAFLTNPKAFVAGTKMNFAGLRKPEDRAAIVAYMRLQADSPIPLP